MGERSVCLAEESRRSAARLSGQVGRARRSAHVLYCNGASDNLRYRSSCGLMPVREIHGFEGPEVYPVSLQGSYPERFQNLSLIDSISYLLLATELDRDAFQSYLATLGTPNQLLQLTVCCSQAQLETSARPARKAAARRLDGR